MNRFIPYMVILGFVINACAPKAVTVKTEELYSEDLSATLPEVEEYVSPVDNTPEPEAKEFTDPNMDITQALDSLLDSIAVVNKQVPYYRYTVLVHNSNSRQAADEARRNVYRVLPDANPQMEFISPSYRVKVGKYFNRLDAYQTLVRLKELFPNAVVVPEQVYNK